MPSIGPARSCDDRPVSDLATVAPAFVAMAHRIVWATVATVDGDERPRGRILHPFWEWDETALAGVMGAR